MLNEQSNRVKAGVDRSVFSKTKQEKLELKRIKKEYKDKLKEREN